MKMEKEVLEIMDAMKRVEWKLDQIMALLARGAMDRVDGAVDALSESGGSGSDAAKVLGGFTTKQHAALQMVLRGASNREIAERFGVTENTAKVYVRSIAAKLGVHSRSQIVASALGMFEDVSEERYLVLSGGLPKGWDDAFEAPDEYEHLYRRKDSDDGEQQT